MDVNKIICYVKPNDNPETQCRIALTQSMLHKMVSWFHRVLGHLGIIRLRDTLQQRYYRPQFRKTIIEYKCGHLQEHKLSGKGFGLLPDRDVQVTLWTEVAIDLIGPCKVKVNRRVVVFNALTSIGTVTNLVKLIIIYTKESLHISRHFQQPWLSRYTHPTRCVHDMGSKFVGAIFQALLARLNIKDVSSTIKNPQ